MWSQMRHLDFLHPFVDDSQPVLNFPCFLHPFLAGLWMSSIGVGADQGHLFYF